MSKRKLTPFRRKYLRFRIKENRRNLKLKAIEYKGGKCVHCGYSKCPQALVFHHVDPSQKEFEISSGTAQSFEKCKPELDKCILLCQNCHSELHYEEYQKERLIQLNEINNEKRKINNNVSITCDTCNVLFTKFNSRMFKNGKPRYKNNFCSKVCKQKYTICGDDELKELLKTKTIKEISSDIKLDISTIYARIRNFK